MNNLPVSLQIELTLKALESVFKKNMQDLGIDIPYESFGILMIVYFQNAVIQQDIADLEHKDKSAVLRQIDLLEKRELVQRIGNEEDRRKKMVMITNKGKKIMEKVVQHEKKMVEELLKDTQPHEVDTFLKVLTRLKINAGFVIKNFDQIVDDVNGRIRQHNVIDQLNTGKRTFIITGGNSGLGFQCARNIALQNVNNYTVIASRNLQKSAEAVKKISQETGNQNVFALKLDLASLTSVRTFYEMLADENLPPLHGLVCNAIAGSSQMTYTDDGFELTFGTGHLGHFLLANLLLQSMNDNGRIVFVSSDQHDPPRWLLKLNYTDARCFAYPKTYNHILQYSGTKLCNLYCTYEMAARIQMDTHKNITVNAFNPGFMADTGLADQAKSIGQKVAKNVAPLIAKLLDTHSSAVQSGKLLADLLTDDKYKGVTGSYFDRGQRILSSELSYNKANAVNLWNQSVELTCLKQEETILKL